MYDVSHVLLGVPAPRRRRRRRAPRALRGGVLRLRLEPRLPLALRVADYWGAVDAAAESEVGAHPVRKGRHAADGLDEPRVRAHVLCRQVVVYGLGLLHLFRSWEPHVEEVPAIPGLRVVCALFVAGYGLNLVRFRRIVRVATPPRARADD